MFSSMAAAALRSAIDVYVSFRREITRRKYGVHSRAPNIRNVPPDIDLDDISLLPVSFQIPRLTDSRVV